MLQDNFRFVTFRFVCSETCGLIWVQISANCLGQTRSLICLMECFKNNGEQIKFHQPFGDPQIRLIAVCA